MKKVFIYYYCDAWKSRDSMKIQKVFADTIKGRKALANHIINAVNANAIELDVDSRVNEIVGICVNNTPIILNDYITYGYIESEYVEG